MREHLNKIWGKAKWFLSEINKTWSDEEKSFFSSKRINQWISFCIGQWMMIQYFIEHHAELGYLEVLALAGAEFTIAGFALNKIQNEKKVKKEKNSDEPSAPNDDEIS